MVTFILLPLFSLQYHMYTRKYSSNQAKYKIIFKIVCLLFALHPFMLINRRKKSDIDFSRLYVIYIPGTCVYVMHTDEEIHVCMDLLLSKCVEIDI